MNFQPVKRRNRVLAPVFAFILALLLSGAALAAYLHTALLGGYTATAAEDFYFTSDLLRAGPDAPVYELYHDWQAQETATIRVKLRNYENALHISEDDVAYTVRTSAAGGSVSGVLSAGAEGCEEAVELSVPRPANPNAPLEVTVTAQASSPYARTLAGRFVLRPALFYEMDQNALSPVAVLTVTLAPRAMESQNVVIAWPAGAVPDMTNPIVTGALSLDLTNRTLTAALPTASVCQLVFFKDDSAGNYAGVTVLGA